MSAAITRQLAVTYGGLTIGGSTDYHLDGPYSLTREYERFTFACEVVVAAEAATTEATFASLCNALEAAFRLPHQGLAVTNNGQSWFTVAPASNTGFLTQATCQKVGDAETDTGRSRRYRIEVTGELPADLSGFNGRRSAKIEVSYTASRLREVRITGTYTALGANSATAQYSASIAAYTTAVLSPLASTFEKVTERHTADDQDKVLDFEVTYKEIILNQAADLLDHPAIVDHVITVQVNTVAPGDSPVGTPMIGDLGWPYYRGGEPKRPVEIELSFACAVDLTVTKDLTALWRDTVEPWLIQHAFAIAGTAFAAITRVARTPTTTANTLAGGLSCLAVEGPVVEHVFTAEIDDEHGLRHQGVYGRNPLEKYRFQDERTVARRCKQTIRLLKGFRGAGPGGQGGAGGAGGAAGAGQGAIPAGIGAGPPGSAFIIGGAPAAGYIPKVGSGGVGFGIGAGPPGSAFIIGGAPAGGGALQGQPSGAQGAGGGNGDLGDLGISPPQDAGGAFWERQRTIQRSRPDRWGKDGYQIDTIILEIESIDLLRVKPTTGNDRTTAADQ